jgi:hypothetical protein
MSIRHPLTLVSLLAALLLPTVATAAPLHGRAHTKRHHAKKHAAHTKHAHAKKSKHHTAAPI